MDTRIYLLRFLYFKSILLQQSFLLLIWFENPLPPPFPPLANVIATIVTVLQICTISTPLIQLLFPGIIFHRNVGLDVWSKLQRTPREFWYLTAETPVTLDHIVQRVVPDVTKPWMYPRRPISNRWRSCIVDVQNRVLLVIIWLRIYPTYHSLASIFQISKSTVQEEIYHIVPILFLHFSTISYMAQCQAMVGISGAVKTLSKCSLYHRCYDT